jgi:molybdate transport system permease protein
VNDAFWVSTRVVLIALLFVIPIGGAIGFFLARTRSPARSLVDAIVLLPLVMPPSATGYFLLVVLGREGVVGGFLEHAFGVRLVFSLAGAAIASGVVALPLMAKGSEAAFARVDRRLEEVARVHGFSATRTFREITLPLALPFLAIAITLAALRTLGEFGATLMFAGYAKGITTTAPLELYVAMQSGDDARARSIAVTLAIVSIAATWLMTRWGRRGFS